MATPSRRSKRFQPTAQVKSEFNGNVTWLGECFNRPVNIPGDLSEDEIEVWDALSEETRPELQTKVYSQVQISFPRPKGRHKSETYSVGDTILVSASRKQPSIAVIVAMWETINPKEPDTVPKKKLRIHWFVRPSELPAIRAQRDHAMNEIYYTISRSDIIPPDSIFSHCTVQNGARKNTVRKSSQGWAASPTKGKGKGKGYEYIDVDSDGEDKESDATFICQYSVDTQRGIFYELVWKAKHKQGVSQDLTELNPEKAWAIIPEKIQTFSRKKVARRSSPDQHSLSEANSSGSEAEIDDEPPSSDNELPDSEEEMSGVEDEASEDDLVPHTPRKRKRTTGGASSPHKPTKRSSPAKATPHSKEALKQRRKAKAKVTTPKRRKIVTLKSSTIDNIILPDLSHLPEDPWVRAMHVLHVGSNPLLSTAPGSGPSRALPCRDAEYNRVLGCVGDLLEEGSGGCVYISGVPGTGKTATVHAVVRELKRLAQNNEVNPFTYVEINGLKLPEPSAAYGLLWEAVSGHNVENDGHLRVSPKEALKELSRHFSSPSSRGPSGHACLVLMDELDQMVTAKQDVIYNFFNWPTLVDSQLVVIAVANTMDLPERHLNARVRSRLGMTRINFQPYSREQLNMIVNARLASSSATLTNDEEKVVIAPDAVRLASMKVASISGDARRVLDICRRAVELVQPEERTVVAKDIHSITKIMQNSPTAAYIRECSLHEQIMLASVIKCIKKLGVEEVRWCEVQDQHHNYTQSLPSSHESTRRISNAEMATVLESLVSSRALIVEEGAAVSKKANGERRIVLNLEEGEIERVLSDKNTNWRNIFS